MLVKTKKLADRFIPFMYKEALRAELSIVEIKGQKINSKKAAVRVVKLNKQGMSFVTDLCFPVHPQILLSFRLYLLKDTIDLFGTIQSSNRVNGMYQLEAGFQIDEHSIVKLGSLLKQLVNQNLSLQKRAAYSYNYFSDCTYDFMNNRINLLY